MDTMFENLDFRFDKENNDERPFIIACKDREIIDGERWVLSLIHIYALLVPTLFSGWYYSHYALANGIWYALIVLGLISWAVSLVRKIRSVI